MYKQYIHKTYLQQINVKSVGSLTAEQNVFENVCTKSKSGVVFRENQSVCTLQIRVESV